MAGLEESLKLQGEELSSLRVKHLKLEEDHSRASTELAELRRRSEEQFKGVAAASADVAMRVQQLDRAADLPGLAPTCQSLPAVAEFLSKAAVTVRSIKNRTARQLRNDQNGASLQTTARVMASFREANPNAVAPNFLDANP